METKRWSHAVRKLIERQLRGIYKAFVKLGSPEFVIKRIAAVHATYFQGVPIEVQMQGKGRAREIHWLETAPHHGIRHCRFFKKALEISGAKDVAIYFSVPIEDGKGFRTLHRLELSEGLAYSGNAKIPAKRIWPLEHRSYVWRLSFEFPLRRRSSRRASFALA